MLTLLADVLPAQPWVQEDRENGWHQGGSVYPGISYQPASLWLK